jgi:hypothetical protein
MPHYVFFVPEMVVQITRTNAKVGSNVVGGDLPFALLIKQFNTGLQNFIFGT